MKRIFINGHIFTSTQEQYGADAGQRQPFADAGQRRPFADSMLAEDGVITWIGREDSGQMPPAEGAEVIDLQGRTVIPGFVDAHMHPVMMAEYSRQIACLPPEICSVEDLVGAIARWDEQTRDAAEGSRGSGRGGRQESWIRGWGYDEGKFAEKRSPNRYDLDRGCADRPVFLVRSCEHVRCVNSKALEIAGITRDTPDPPGGSIDRDERGEPTGILRESARDLILPHMPKETEEDMADALVELGRKLLAKGIVAIGDMGNLRPGTNYALLERAAEKGFLQRVAMYDMWDYLQDDPGYRITPEQADRRARRRIAGIKLIGDGSISGRTAWLSEPYRGSEDSGMPVYSDESLEKAIAFARENRCQIAVHAMGGRAIDRILDRIVREEDWLADQAGRAAGHPFLRLEHLTEPSDRAMEIAAERGIAFVSQPIFAYCEIETYLANLGEERLKELYPYRTELEAGIRLAFSSDAPATSWAVPYDPFTNLKAAVTRRAYDGTDTGQKERIDIQTAVMLYTKNAAEVCGFDGLGQLREGWAADFAVLSEDIFAIPPEEIDRAVVEETWIGGERVYKTGGEV